MPKNYLWTRSGARLQFVKSHEGTPINWIFLPGGPGLGSESLQDLVDCLNLPGTIWLMDLPGDGSNVGSHPADSFQNWAEALLDAVSAFDQVILIGHSSGGMYALSQPLLEQKLKGLILIDSAPDISWHVCLEKMFQNTPLPEFERLDAIHRQNPTNSTLKDLTVAAAPYFFSKAALSRGISLLESLPYNVKSFDWSDKNFDPTYKALWIPKTMPTLIIAGAQDSMTPLELFKNSKNFQRPNILMLEIPDAGHFPWLENPEAVSKAFNDFFTNY